MPVHECMESDGTSRRQWNIRIYLARYCISHRAALLNNTIEKSHYLVLNGLSIISAIQFLVEKDLMPTELGWTVTCPARSARADPQLGSLWEHALTRPAPPFYNSSTWKGQADGCLMEMDWGWERWRDRPEKKCNMTKMDLDTGDDTSTKCHRSGRRTQVTSTDRTQSDRVYKRVPKNLGEWQNTDLKFTAKRPSPLAMRG